ncbi:MULTISPECIES: esterase/lipase family protein [unclassified Acinetobacter]|uniref:esterase/lipase family protein n=1 Tax=unclassified Acinetobacter TaxID=196816 RepID=UPI000DCF8353|nr:MULTISPECIES: triacylglycerol lipase [unclassified Acinetobacter]
MKGKLLCATLLASMAVTQTHAELGIQQATTKKVIDNYAETQYPLVFVHGMFGFNRLGGAVFGLDYWYQVLPDLASHKATAFATQISPLESIEVRGEQLLDQVEQVVAITGKHKVNLIGHSHGGPTARYIAGVRPDLVASVSTVAGTNDGSPVADLVQSVPILNGVLATVMDALMTPVINFAQQSNLPSNFKASIYSMSQPGVKAFNAKFPLGMPTTKCADGPNVANGISFYSWTGISNTTNLLDPDTIFTAMGPIAFSGQPNDGLVSQCSSKLGKTIRDNYKWNHFDEVNQVLGLKGLFAPDPVSVYRQHANRLKLQGL